MKCCWNLLQKTLLMHVFCQPYIFLSIFRKLCPIDIELKSFVKKKPNPKFSETFPYLVVNQIKIICLVNLLLGYTIPLKG